jgi:hypothetical protein
MLSTGNEVCSETQNDKIGDDFCSDVGSHANAILSRERELRESPDECRETSYQAHDTDDP